jgi:cytochrome c5
MAAGYRTKVLALLPVALAAQLLLAARPAAAQACIDKCAEHVTPVSSAVRGAHAKASSFAPQGPHTGPKVYGEPIQKPILKSHPKPKPHLKATPLP